MKFLAELKRRNVIRMAGLYLVGAWLVVQVTSTVLPMFAAPDWLARSIVVMLMVGFVPALVISWIFELTPEGLQREDDLSADRRAGPRSDRRLRRISDRAPGQATSPVAIKRVDRLIIAVLVMALAFFVTERFLRSDPEPAAETVAGVRVPVAGLVAVLPFRNRSKREEDAYFAEGIHDDLLTQLSKVAGLKVISRTSMMRYENTKLSIPEIAAELGAAVILEGAVQRAGDEVRITVQLIDGASDVHLWAEKYDRALNTNNLFAIQADIAQAVTLAMQVALSPAVAKALSAGSTSSIEAYEAFIQGKLLAAHDRATPERFADALRHFDRAIALDPGFADAYARRARTQLASYWFAYADASMREAAIQSTEQARTLAPDSIETWMAEAYLHYWGERNYAAAEATLQRVIKRAPNYAEAWYARALVARRDGRFEDSIQALQRSLVNDPANTDTLLELQNTYVTLGRRAEAEGLKQRLADLGQAVASHSAESAFNAGDYAAAWAALDGPNDFYATLPFRIALASGNKEWLEQALSPALWPRRLRKFPDYPEVYALAQAEALLATGQPEAAAAALDAIKQRRSKAADPYPGGWSSSGNYFYFPCDLPGLQGDLEGVRAAERDFRENAPRDVWSEGGARMALAVAYARAGDPDAALTQLEALSKLYGPVTFGGISNSAALTSLRQHPRYLALAEAHAEWVAQYPDDDSAR